MILLDINMPGAANGLDVLRQIKSHPRTQRMPVIMLTSTENPTEVARCYELGCNVYVTKPIDPRDFVEAIRRIGLFVEIVRIAPFSPEHVNDER
jgi:CheY-like chemotaxis protein